MAAAISAGGAQIQPIFQPVVLNVLPPLEITSVRSRMPGKRGQRDVLGVVEHEVLVDLVGDDDQVVLDGEVGDAAAARPRSAPARSGCAGVLISSSLVFGVIAARNSSGSKPYVGGRSVTGLATAPARAMHAW